MELTIIAFIFVFILNIPFGAWRGKVKKFSAPWFLAVHVPVPFIILFRIYMHLGWAWTTYPVLVGAYFSGQWAGSKIPNHIRIIYIPKGKN